MMMTLYLVKETDQARLYRKTKNGKEQWVPRSVCTHTTKFPSAGGELAKHEVTLASWWLKEHPFESGDKKTGELF